MDQATESGDAVTESAGAIIHPLAANPDTAFVADAAREAMTQKRQQFHSVNTHEPGLQQ